MSSNFANISMPFVIKKKKRKKKKTFIVLAELSKDFGN